MENKDRGKMTGFLKEEKFLLTEKGSFDIMLWRRSERDVYKSTAESGIFPSAVE